MDKKGQERKTSMKKCPVCGKEWSDATRFCGSCGAKLEDGNIVVPDIVPDDGKEEQRKKTEPVKPSVKKTIEPVRTKTRETAENKKIAEEKGVCKINEGVVPEFIGIVNYSIMGLIQLELGPGEDIPTDQQRISQLYENYFQKAKALMLDKNHDYGEAWRSMRTSSYTDLILMKINRTKQIEDNQGNTLISEGIDANYYDMINYAVFALIRLTVENVNL